MAKAVVIGLDRVQPAGLETSEDLGMGGDETSEAFEDVMGVQGGPASEALEEAVELMEEERRERLVRLAAELKRLLGEAQDARAASGVERLWRYARAVKAGRDATAQGGAQGALANWYKPASPEGRPIYKSGAQGGDDGGSAAYVNVTRPTVEFAAWAAKEMALPENKEDLWELKATPMGLADDLMEFGEMVPQMQEQLQVAAAQIEEKEREQIARAERRIKDALAEGPESLEMATIRLFDAAADLGVGVWQWPVPMDGMDGKTVPGIRFVRPQRVFPDPACGGSLQDGSYVFEGPEPKSARQLRGLMKEAKKGEGGWVKTGLEEVLEKGRKDRMKAFEFWFFEGEVPARLVEPLLEEMGCMGETVEGEGEPHVFISAVLCEDEIVRLSASTLDGMLSYHNMRWREFMPDNADDMGAEEYWAGMGETPNLESIQRSVNINWRAMEANAQLAAVPQIVRWKGVIKPENGVNRLSPGKLWNVEIGTYSTENAKAVRDAFMAIDIPCHVEVLQGQIPFALSMIGHVTGLGDVLRGIEPGQQVGTVQVQLNTGSQLAKRVGAYFREFFKGVLQGAVQWERQYGGLVGVPKVVIKPPPTQVTRDVDAANLTQALGMSLNPAFGQDPKLMFSQWMLRNQMDPSQTALSEERAQELAQANNKPDEKAQAAVASAQVRAEANVQAAQVDAEAKREKTAMDAENAAREREHKEKMLVLEAKLRLLDYAVSRQIDFQTAQAELEQLDVEKAIGKTGGEE